MAYTIDKAISLEFPASLFENVKTVVEAAMVEYQSSYFAVQQAEFTIAEDGDLAVALESLFGTGSINVYRGGGQITVVGAAWDKETDGLEGLLHELGTIGVRGTVDCRGEDGQLWRDRLTEVGLVGFEGYVRYPDDPEDVAT